MLDFEITNSGDIKIEKNELTSSLTIRFLLNNSPALRIQFDSLIEENYKTKIKEDICRFSFKTKKKAIKEYKNFKIAKNDDAIRQQIMMRLRTEIGDVKAYKDYGSRLHEIKHFDIRSSAVLSKIKNITEDIISDFLDNYEIVVKTEKNDDSYFYCQNVNIYIYNNDYLFYKFSI